MKKFLSLLIISLFFIPMSLLKAQNVEDYLIDILEKGYGENYIKGYTQPLSTALGTAMGGSLYHRGYTKGFPRFDVGISAVYIQLPSGAKEFESPANVSIAGFQTGQGNVPTVFGDKDLQINGAIPGAGTDAFALPMLHANLGLLANLEATARFITADIDYLGKLTIYGGGLKYGLSELLPIGLLPLDFSIQAAYHKFTLGEFIDAGTFSMNLQASVSIPVLPLDVYGGIGIDNSSMIIKTDAFNVPGINMGDVTVDGENAFRYNLGVSLTLMILNVHADYTIGEYNAFGAGLMFVL